MPSVPPVAEWTARLPEALGGVVVALATAMIARAVYSPAIGLFAGLLVCGTSGLFRYANTARPEMLYAACCSLMLLGFVRSWRADTARGGSLGWALLGWASAGLGVLAKGPHVPGLMLLGFAIAMWREGGVRRIWTVFRPLQGVLVAAAIAAPWPIAVTMRVENSFGVWFGQMSDEPARAQRPWRELLSPFYLVGVPQILLPWALLLLPFGLASVFVKGPLALKRGLPLMWVFAVVFVALSVVTHRREYYMLPMLCVLCPLMAAGTADVLRKGSESVKGRRLVAIVSLLVVACMIGGVAMLGWIDRAMPDVRLLCLAGAGVGVVLLIWGIALARSGALGLRLMLPALLAIPVGLAAAGASPTLWGSDSYERGVFARQVASAVKPGETVLLYGEQAGLVTYELGRPAPEVTTREDLARLVGSGTAWIVLPPERMAELPVGVPSKEVARLTARDPGESRVLMRLGN